MSGSLSNIPWRRVLGAALAVIALSFLVPILVTTVYAFSLAFQARGAPDQASINHFAARITPQLMPWLEMLFTLLMAFRVARNTAAAAILSGLTVGVLAGLFSLALTLAFGGHPGGSAVLALLTTTALGCLGGFLATKR